MIGQPHIMVRAMTVDKVEHMATARRVYLTWNMSFAALAILVALAARAYLDGQSLSDPELALPTLATNLLPAVLVGLVLAGIFSAVISTADSQILSCSAALTQDIFPQLRRSYNWAKLATLGVTAMVLMVALSGGSVFDLVTMAWSALAAGFGPLLILRAFGRDVDGRLAISHDAGRLADGYYLALWTATQQCYLRCHAGQLGRFCYLRIGLPCFLGTNFQGIRSNQPVLKSHLNTCNSTRKSLLLIINDEVNMKHSSTPRSSITLARVAIISLLLTLTACDPIKKFAAGILGLPTDTDVLFWTLDQRDNAFRQMENLAPTRP